jgi:hypothetical protein
MSSSKLDYFAEMIASTAEAEAVEKLAALPLRGLRPLMRELRVSAPNTGRLVGLGAGAAVGAGAGALASPEDRAGGALKGGLIGGGAGLVGGQFLTRGGVTQAKNFGLRQLHGATGYLPGQGLAGVHSMTPAQRTAALEQIGWNVPKGHAVDQAGKLTAGALGTMKSDIAAKRGGLAKWFSGTGVGSRWEGSKARDLLLRSRAASENANRALVEQGLTNLPGAARGYALGAKGTGLTRLQQLKTNLIAPGIAMGVGLPALSIAGSAAESLENKDPRGFASDVVDTAGWSAFAGLPMLPALAVGQGIGAGSRLLLGKRPNPAEVQRLVGNETTWGPR